MLFFVIEKAYAAAGEEAHGVPLIVLFQFINFSLFSFLLWFLLKEKIKKFFKHKQDSFNQIFKEASAKKEKALNKLTKFEQKLEEIINTKSAQIEKAKVDSLKPAKQLLEASQYQIAKINYETKETIELSYKKAFIDLKKYLLLKSSDNFLENIKKISIDKKDSILKFQQEVKNESL